MFGPGAYVPDPTEGIVDANDLPMPLVVPYDRNHDYSPCPRCGHLACIGSLSICDSIARMAAFAFADGGRLQRRVARTADPELYQLKGSISPSKFLRNLAT